MKVKRVLFIIISIIIISFLLYGCKTADTSDLEERIAELEAEAAQNQSGDASEELPEKPVTEEPKEDLEEIQIEYHPECELSFEEGNIFEISTEGLDFGYPHFTFAYPDGWEIIETPYAEIGYLVLFNTPTFIEVEVENIEPFEQPFIDERVIILNEEFSSMMPSEVVEHYYNYEVFNSPDIEILSLDNIDDKIFLVLWQEHSENTWWVQYRFTQIEGYSFVHVVSAIDYCYDPWSDLLINTTIEERLVIENITVVEHVEEATENSQTTLPTIGLTVIEGPISEEGLCYYRVQADTGGSPSPNITFNRDDSNGVWGADIAQVNLTSPNDSFVLIATAANAAGSATDSLTLAWGCEVPKEEPKDEGAGEEEQQKESEDPIDCPEVTSIDIYNFYEPPSSSIDISGYQNPGDDWVWVKANIIGDKSGLDYQWLLPSGYIVETYGNIILWDASGESGNFDITLNMSNSSGCSDSYTRSFYRG